MTIRHISARIELNFWQILIGLMSGSQPIQRFIRWIYLRLLPSTKELIKNIDQKRLIRWGAIGLGLGAIFGLLTVMF